MTTVAFQNRIRSLDEMVIRFQGESLAKPDARAENREAFVDLCNQVAGSVHQAFAANADALLITTNEQFLGKLGSSLTFVSSQLQDLPPLPGIQSSGEQSFYLSVFSIIAAPLDRDLQALKERISRAVGSRDFSSLAELDQMHSKCLIKYENLVALYKDIPKRLKPPQSADQLIKENLRKFYSDLVNGQEKLDELKANANKCALTQQTATGFLKERLTMRSLASTALAGFCVAHRLGGACGFIAAAATSIFYPKVAQIARSALSYLPRMRSTTHFQPRIYSLLQEAIRFQRTCVESPERNEEHRETFTDLCTRFAGTVRQVLETNSGALQTRANQELLKQFGATISFLATQLQDSFPVSRTHRELPFYEIMYSSLYAPLKLDIEALQERISEMKTSRDFSSLKEMDELCSKCVTKYNNLIFLYGALQSHLQLSPDMNQRIIAELNKFSAGIKEVKTDLDQFKADHFGLKQKITDFVKAHPTLFCTLGGLCVASQFGTLAGSLAAVGANCLWVKRGFVQKHPTIAKVAASALGFFAGRWIGSFFGGLAGLAATSYATSAHLLPISFLRYQQLEGLTRLPLLEKENAWANPNYSLLRRASNYLEGLFQGTIRSLSLYQKVELGLTNIVIVGRGEFKEKILEAIKKLCTRKLGRDLIQNMATGIPFRISEGELSEYSAFDLEKLKRNPPVLFKLDNIQMSLNNGSVTVANETTQRERVWAENPLFSVLAHEMIHRKHFREDFDKSYYLLRVNLPQLTEDQLRRISHDMPEFKDLPDFQLSAFTNLEELRTIAGREVNPTTWAVTTDPFSENAVRANFGLAPNRASHLGSDFQFHSLETVMKGCNRLHDATNAGLLFMMKFFLEQGFSPNSFDGKGLTPLHYAVITREYKPLELLMAQEATDPNLGLSKAEGNARLGDTPLHVASGSGDRESVRILLNSTRTAARVRVDQPNDLGETPLHYSVREGHRNTLEELLSRNANPNAQTNGTIETPLHYAAKRGNTDQDAAALTLLRTNRLNPADPKAQNHKGELPLHLAAQKGHHRIIFALLPYDTVNDRTRNIGETPLHYSAGEGHLEASRALLSFGANPNAEANETKETPLHYAARKGHHLVIVILATPTNVNARTKNRETPLHFSTREGHLEATRSLLGIFGVEVNATTSDDNTPLHLAVSKRGADAENTVDLLVAKGAKCNAKNNLGNTVLHSAVLAKSAVFTRKFAAGNFGIINETNNDGETAVHYAIRANFDEGLEILLQSGADRTIRTGADRRGFTPLHYAILNGNLRAVRALCQNNSRIISENHPDGRSPLKLAEDLHHRAIVDFLKTVRA